MINNYIKNEIGNRYGRLTVVSFSHLNKHHKAVWLCKCDCGNGALITGSNLRKGETRSCGCLVREISGNRLRGIRGDKSPFWKGGKWRINGYIKAYAPNHPRANKEGMVREHILIMEQMLGRLLAPGEVVHHLNNDGTDNRPCNLKLYSSHSEHIAYHNKLRGHREIIQE